MPADSGDGIGGDAKDENDAEIELIVTCDDFTKTTRSSIDNASDPPYLVVALVLWSDPERQEGTR